MPIYEYKCPKCGEKIELIVPFDHKAPQCPKCQEPMQMQFGSYGFQIKGAPFLSIHNG
jgi:putative FmdB family regulatory protein